jgi:hypothetical protein
MNPPERDGKTRRQRRSSELDRQADLLARLIADGSLDSLIGITCRGKVDGAGAQALAVISAMVMARFARCRYLHSPFVQMAHGDEPADWAQRWEAFLNFGEGEARTAEDAIFVPLSAAVNDPAAYRGRPIVIAQELYHLPEWPVAPVRDALRSELRARYWRSPKAAIPSHRAPTGFTTAIHMRRGDVSTTRHAGRYVEDPVMLRAIARLRKAVAPLGRPLTINLYSEGTPDEFRAFADLGCRLHISEDAFESFHNMVTADILMIASSSFSRVAGLLCEGIVIDHARHSSRLSNWMRRRRNGDVPIGSLRRALLARLDWVERGRYQVRRWPRLAMRLIGRAASDDRRERSRGDTP